jgi:hypothetical protein
MHIGHSDCAAATAFFIGTNPNNHHLIFRAAEILPFILNTVRQLAYCVEGITDIQFTLVLLYIRGLVKINEKISKCLISPGILFIATPQTDLIELYMLRSDISKNHPSKSPVTNRQNFGHPILCRFVVPEFK